MAHKFDRDKFRVILREKGYTTYDFAKLIGVSQSAISRYLTGRSAPSFIHIRKIAELLMVDVDDLLTGELTSVVKNEAPIQEEQYGAPIEAVKVDPVPITANVDRKEELILTSLQTVNELLKVATEMLKDVFAMKKGESK